jgi:hypothetical protein
MATLTAELELGWIGRIALRANPFQFRPALSAKIHTLGIFNLALWTIHECFPQF